VILLLPGKEGFEDDEKRVVRGWVHQAESLYCG